MFLKELFEDRNDDLTKVNWPPKSGEDAYQPGDVYKQRMKKDESKPTSVVPLLQNWVERNNATDEGAQILYALVKHLESSDPGIVEKVLNFIKDSEGMDESLEIQVRGSPAWKATEYRKSMEKIPSADIQRDARIKKKERLSRTFHQAKAYDDQQSRAWTKGAKSNLQNLVGQES